jgi:medium-chain acyl-[acyl-carrier-protein] hydrolase
VVSKDFWLPEPRPRARLRLYCFAHAGAGASTFGRWGAAAPSDIEIVAIQLPGREARMDEAPFRKLTDAARRIGEAIAGADTRPLALFGHSAGGKLAAHVALRLQGTARRPVRLFVSAGPVSVAREDWLHHLDESQFARAVAKEFGALPAEITADPELWQLFETPLRADLEALETDEITTMRLNVPVTVISGTRDDVVEPDDLAGWKACADRIVYATVDADHFSYRTSPGAYFDVIARQLFGSQ